MTNFREKSQVTVVIPTYLHDQYIAQCLDSVLEQTRQPADIIVINDGSPDNTHAAVAPYLSQIRYIKQENHGLPYTLNRGVAMVHTEYVMFLGSDDWLCPTALKVLEEAMDAHSDVAVAHANRWKVEPGGERVAQDEVHPYLYNALHPLAKQNCILGPVIMLRTRARLAVNHIPNFPYCRDWAVFLHMAINGWKFYGIADRLGYYRRHSGNTTHIRNAQAILADEITMLQWISDIPDVAYSPVHSVISESIRLRLRGLGWLHLQSGQQQLAKIAFADALRFNRRDWNTLLGWGAAQGPHALYQWLKTIRQRLDLIG